MSWSTTSKAADKSKRVRNTTLLLSIDCSRLFKIWMRAVSVLGRGLYADEIFQRGCLRQNANLIGLLLLAPVFWTKMGGLKRVYSFLGGAQDLFFNLGTTIACFSVSGIGDEANDLFMIWTIVGTSSSVHCFKRVVGIGSSKHELFEEDLMNFVTYAASTGVKECNLSVISFTSNWRLSAYSGKFLLILSIFEMKKSFSSLLNSCAGLFSGKGVSLFRWSRVFMHLKKAPWSWDNSFICFDNIPFLLQL